MPVLDLEASVWPEDLFSTERCIEDSKLRWWVLHTRPRSEKSLARRLVAHNVSFYLPLYQRRQRYQRRLVVSHLPLFPSYLFLLGNEETRVTAFDTKLVVGSLEVFDQRQLSQELGAINDLIEYGERLAPEERLQPGTPAEIISGPLAGYRGTVIRVGKSFKLVLEVKLLQRGVSVEVDTSMIRPL